MRTLLALLSALFVTAAAQAKDQGESMKNVQTTQTLCLGRFLVDVPRDAYVVANTSNYRWDNVSVTRRISQEKFIQFISDKERKLRETKHEKEASLLKHISKNSDGTSVVMVFWETPETEFTYETEGYKWIKGFQFLVKGHADDDRASSKAGKVGNTLSELRYRQNDETPTTPGFCVDNGFFVGEPSGPHREEAYIHLRFKNNPDVDVEISTDLNSDKLNEGLLARVDRKPVPDIYKELAKGIKTLRRGQHPVGEIRAEELLQTYPTDGTYSTHLFTWEATGKPHDIYAPSMVINLETGETQDGEKRRPNLTDKQVIELFDSIVNSIRVRPVNGRVASREQSSPAPRQ